MAPITNVTIGTTATAIDTTGSIPPVLFNASNEDMTLQFGGDGDTLELKAGQARQVMAAMLVTAFCASGGKTLQVLRGINLLNGSAEVSPAYDVGSDSLNAWRTNPEWAHQLRQTVVDLADQDDSTENYYIDMAGFKFGVLQLALDCDAGTVTVTVEASFQDEGQQDDASLYDDVTDDLFGVASLVASAAPAAAVWRIDTPFPARFLKVKVVYASTDTSADATIYFRGVN